MRLLFTTSVVFAICASVGQVNAADMNNPYGYGQNGAGGYGTTNGGSGGYGYGNGGAGYGGQGDSGYMGIRGTKSGDCYQLNKSRSFFDIFKRKRSNNFSLNCQDYNGAGGYAGHGIRGHAGNGAHDSGSGNGTGHGAGVGFGHSAGANGSAHGVAGSGHGAGSGGHSHGSTHGSAHGAGGLAGNGAGGSGSHDGAGNSTNGHVHNGHGINMRGSIGSGGHGVGGHGAGRRAGGYGAGGFGGYGAGGYGAGGASAGIGGYGAGRASAGYGGFGAGGASVGLSVSGGNSVSGSGSYGASGSGSYGVEVSGGYGVNGNYDGYGSGSFGAGWYLRGDVGFASLNLSKVEKQVSYIDSVSGDIVYDGGSFYSSELDSSWTISAGLGYQVSNSLRVDAILSHIGEVDFKGDSSTSGSGYSCNLIDGQTDDDGDTCTTVDSATFSATIGMANAYIDLGNFAGFTPYIGGGIGGAYVHWSDMKNDTRCDATGSNCTSTAGLSYENEFDGVHGNKSGWRFAYAAHAGASYQITNSMKFDAGYSFTNISGGDMFGFAVGDGVQGRHGDIQVHEVKAGIRYSFH